MTTTDRQAVRLVRDQPEPVRQPGPRPLQPETGETRSCAAATVTKADIREFKETWKRASRMIELALDRLCAE